ncbi:DUF1643 domain-containing protein [Sulfuricurvum sp.]|uniref:DUF1643 domain-containing protein n=1 Tax=Sulfuricurvum sp. TaxID=2025608 RepID=UPI00262B50ED|nr:DUF1643 domain-containing protein [Sulfuricurvum sp.]MDD2266936.1 DUF1643 domain-containing protein [Sulfuricurvum sp.]MDD2783618.1 DUF1643 domain-containing protein [Sulfuricurvum sp.]
MIKEEIIYASAEFSDDKLYRYWLKRVWDEDKEIGVFIALNPSKATELKCDQTICNITNLALQWDWGGFYLLNLFAFRSTEKKLMLINQNPIGEKNDEMIEAICKRSNNIVLSWGEEKPKLVKDRASKVKQILNNINRNVLCLSENAGSGYQHPCIIKVEDFKEPRVTSINQNAGK